MIEEIAIVTRTGNGRVWIKSRQNSACSGCMQQDACGAATISKLFPGRELAVDCPLSLQVGDRVRVAIDDSHLLFSSVLLYVLPLLIMLAGVGLADALLPASEAGAWLPEIALLNLLLAFWLIHRLQPLILLLICVKPQIVARLAIPDSADDKIK
ncbi:MAG: SoxR reducing system RseC family protein [Methylococcaceae bacterium]|nr:SoxR reducing system RseC family protein [Methylococcaceae bacterium]